MTLAPLRFRHERVQISLLQLSAGIGPDTFGAGTLVGVTLLQVGASL